MTNKKNDSTEGSPSNARRRIVVPKKKEIKLSTDTFIPTTDLLLHDIKCIIGSEVAKYRQKTSKGISLDLKEARVVQGYAETITKMLKEEREQARADDLSNLSNEELFDLATKVLKNQPKAIEVEDED